MYRDEQTVLRCTQCNKPFDKHSTLRRHGYYCRSRTEGSKPRARSCISCVNAKVRCDNKKPACARCASKAVECCYPAHKAKGVDSKTERQYTSTDDTLKTSSSPDTDSPDTESSQEPNYEGKSFDQAAQDIDFTTFDSDFLQWPDLSLDSADSLSLQSSSKAFQSSQVATLSPLTQATLSFDHAIRAQEMLFPYSVSIPPVPTHEPRSLILRPRSKVGATGIADLIFHMLKSYPLMMMKHNTLPPFIHPHSMSSELNDILTEPLTNCINLVRMIGTEIQGSRKLFWLNVRIECERLCDTAPRLNKWEIAAAMQALFIYILIRLGEGETEYNNCDALLISTVAALSRQFARTDVVFDIQSRQYNGTLQEGWKEWIFEESGRRLCVVYQVVDMLVFFEPAAICAHASGLVLAPLPTRRHLWEASNAAGWGAESERGLGFEADFGLATNGELVKLDNARTYYDDMVQYQRPVHKLNITKSPVNWEEWCSGMDGFGGLIMLAAALIG